MQPLVLEEFESYCAPKYLCLVSSKETHTETENTLAIIDVRVSFILIMRLLHNTALTALFSTLGLWSFIEVNSPHPRSQCLVIIALCKVSQNDKLNLSFLRLCNGLLLIIGNYAIKQLVHGVLDLL